VTLFTYGYGHSVWEVADSCLGCGTIVGGVFHPARQLARFSPLNMQFIISLRGQAVNYRPFASPSFEAASHVQKCHFGHYYYLVYFLEVYEIGVCITLYPQ